MKPRPYNARGWQIRPMHDGTLSRVVVPIDKLTGRFGVVRQFGRSDTAGYDWHFRDRDGRWHDLRHAALLKALPFSPGDRLWVRETYVCDHYAFPKGDPVEMRALMDYRASHSCHAYEDGCPCDDGQGRSSWRASTTMPRWASRTTLVVGEVRVCRVQDLTKTEAVDAGVLFATDVPYVGAMTCDQGRQALAEVWSADHGPDAWERNPWVASAAVEVHHRNVDSMEEAA